MFDFLFEYGKEISKRPPNCTIDSISDIDSPIASVGSKYKMDKQFGLVKKLAHHPKYEIDAYGFLTDMQGVDRFFHWSEMSRKSTKPFHHLETGDRVSFIPHQEEIDGEIKEQALEVEYVFKESRRKDNARS